MIWTTLILNLLFLLGSSDKIDVVGTYLRSTKGLNSTSWSTTIMELNCDSTVSVDLRIHGGQTNWKGVWRTHSDTLVVNIKPIIAEDGTQYLGSWENVNQFLVKKDYLVPIVTKLKGEKIKDSDLLRNLNRNLKKEKYKRTKNKRCT
jgi:hypothetical protein